MATKSFRHHQRDGVTEFFRLLRANYAYTGDNATTTTTVGVVVPSTSEGLVPLVTKRSENTYISAHDTHDRITERYRRLVNNRSKGFFACEHEPYAALGQPELDAQRLVIKDLADCLDPNISAKYEQFLRRRDIPPQVHKDSDHKTSLPKEDAEEYRLEMLKRKATCAKAGLRDIKDLLHEVQNRRIFVKAGGSYIQHVLGEKVKARQAAADKEEEDKTATSMKCQELSEEYLVDALATPGIPIDDGVCSLGLAPEDSQAHSESTSQVFDGGHTFNHPKRQAFLQKIRHIYNLLCEAYNVKSRWLKQRHPLKEEVLRSLRRCPFSQESIMKPNTPMTLLPGRDSRRTSLRTKALLQPVSRPYTGASRMSIVRMSEGHAPTSSITAKIDLSTPSPFNNKKRNTHVHYSNKEEKDGRVFPEIVMASRLDTWEDMLNTNTKRSARIHKRVPPWTVPVPSMPPIKMEEKANESCPDDKESERRHDESTITRLQNQFLWLKEGLQAKAQQLTKKQEKERLGKYRAKSAMLDDLLWQEPLWERQRLCFDDVNQRPHDTGTTSTDYPEWYDQLQEECVNLRLSEDPVVAEAMDSLCRFAKEDLRNTTNLKEKLALVICSTPIRHICTPQVQQAMKFVLQQILYVKPDYFEQWLSYRNLYVI